MNIAELRNSVRATREVTYFNTGWSGPSPDSVIARIQEVVEKEASAGPASLESQRLAREINEMTRQTIASLFKADQDEVMVTHGTTEGLHIVLYGYPWQPGDELVTCGLEHPALGSPPAVLEERYGVVTRKVDIPPTASEEEQLKLITDAINSKTKIVALSHIQFSCGLRMPIQAIAEAAHRAGALMLVDGAQTGGAIDIDARGLGADFYAISGQKWLMGPQGTGALYVAREHSRDIAPLFNTHAIADHRAEMLEAAGPPSPLQRFRVTSQSVALVAGMGEAARLLQEVGMDAVEAHDLELAAQLRTGLAGNQRFTLTGPREGSSTSALVSVALEGWQPRQVVEALWDRWRIAARAVGFPAAVRFSCHAFNNADDIDQALSAMRTLATEEAPPVVEGAH